jgi:Rrf2 family transcriptional regulator, iron-sulfur cluster assembly transcription factor
MVSRTGRYALRILGYLADRPYEWVQGSQIASETGIPANYLSKILNQLRKRGFVSSQKGWGGGFLFKEQASRIPIAQVLDLFEGPKEKGQCLFGLGECDAKNPCPLHAHWEKIQESYADMLNSITVGDLRSASKNRKRRR